MDIQYSIDEFLDFILNNPEIQPDLGELIRHLDLLSVCVHAVKFNFDENEYPDPPEHTYSETRLIIGQKFPNIGFYYSVDSDMSDGQPADVTVGDAVDDLADIVGDLKDVQWYFENTSIDNALWHFQTSFSSHWGLHLKELQLVLHREWW